jgi:electron transport complex protein RnfD
MLTVVFGLLPGIAAYVYFFGWGVAINLSLAVLVGLTTEALMLILRRRPLRPYLSDGSVIVTTILLGMALPPLSPWWLTTVGVVFAVIFAKHLYGGLGFNPFNPAMAGYAVLLVSFPREMTTWLPPEIINQAAHGFRDAWEIILHGPLAAGQLVDALSMATPLDWLKTEVAAGKSIEEAVRGSPLFGAVGGRGWEWVNAAFLVGGLWLIYRRVVTWHIPAGLVAGLLIPALLLHLYAPQHYASPLFHLFSGATMLGAFFIATDPVTASTTPRGRVLFGAGVGVLTYVIRTWGGYPDAIAFAVLLMNMVAPTLDQYTQPRVYGHKR